MISYDNGSNEKLINTRIIEEWKTSDSALEYEKKNPGDIDNDIVVIVLRICRDQKKNKKTHLLLYCDECKADYFNIVVN